MSRSAAIVAALLCTSTIVHANPFTPHGPIQYRNQNPIYLHIAGLTPSLAQSLPAGNGEISLRVEHSNVFEFFIDTAHEERIDLEQSRHTFGLSYGLPKNFTLDVEVPLVNTSAGAMDQFLQWWHRTLHVDNAGREFVPNDQFVFHVLDFAKGTTLYEVPQVKYGLGDISLRLRKQFADAPRSGQWWQPNLAFFAQLEPPTGKRSKGLGNGNLDFGFGLLADRTWGRFHGLLNVGYFVGAPTPTLAAYQRTEQFNFATGLEYSISHAIAAHAQLSGGTPLLRGLLNSRWDSFPLDLMLGLSGDHPAGAHGERVRWQAGLSEDINPNGPSIDVTLQARVGYAWGGG